MLALAARAARPCWVTASLLATEAGQVAVPAGATAALWAVAGLLFAIAGDAERGIDAAAHAPAAPLRMRWIDFRTLLPLVLVLGLQGVAVASGQRRPRATWDGMVFGVVLVTELGLAFGRQAYLLRRPPLRVMVRERAAPARWPCAATRNWRRSPAWRRP